MKLHVKIKFFAIWLSNLVLSCGKCKSLLYGYVDESDGYFVNNSILHISHAVIGPKLSLRRMSKII